MRSKAWKGMADPGYNTQHNVDWTSSRTTSNRYLLHTYQHTFSTLLPMRRGETQRRVWQVSVSSKAHMCPWRGATVYQEKMQKIWPRSWSRYSFRARCVMSVCKSQHSLTCPCGSMLEAAISSHPQMHSGTWCEDKETPELMNFHLLANTAINAPQSTAAL